MKLSTRCIHIGLNNDEHGSPNTPLYDTTTFSFSSTEKMKQVIESEGFGYLYTRYGSNPSIVNVEKKLASIETADTAIVFSSGMAAISATLLAHGESGIVCLGEVFGGTWALINSQLNSLGRKAVFLSPENVDMIENSLKEGNKLIYFETPNNPFMQMIDVAAVSSLAHKYNAVVAVDSTFATPVNQQTLALGADIVIHSATKYLGGHSDLTGGMVAGDLTLINPIKVWRKNLGQIMSPDIAHLLSRSLATLEIRVKKQNATAINLAKLLEKHHLIEKVYYPGLQSHPGHRIAKKQMSGFGGVISIILKKDIVSPTLFVDKLNYFILAPSLGGVESLVSQPVLTSHRDLPSDIQTKSGIDNRLIRLSIGLESYADLEADLIQALDFAKVTTIDN